MDLHDVCVCVCGNFLIFGTSFASGALSGFATCCGKVVTALKEGTAVPPHDPANPVQK